MEYTFVILFYSFQIGRLIGDTYIGPIQRIIIITNAYIIVLEFLL